MRDAFVRALTGLAGQDPSIVLVNGDLGFGVLADFIDRFPDNYVNVGVAEQNMTAVACGMALAGARAYTYSIANFPTLRCLEQLRNDVCYHGADVTVVAVGAGFSYGQLGMSHFATEDFAILRSLPGICVVAPSDPWQAHELTLQLHRRGGPAYLRIDKSSAGLPPGPVTLGRARQVREGADAVVFATGGILGEAVAAADELAHSGAQISVFDLHTIKPFDAQAVCKAATRCGAVLTVEEHARNGGLGGTVAEALLDAGIAPRRFRRLGLDDCFADVVGDQSFLRSRYGIDRAAIRTALEEMM